MTYQQERDEFIAQVTKEGVNVTTARKLLALASKLQKFAELTCSSERADRDRVPCPKRFRPTRLGGECICDDQGLKDGDQHGDVPRHVVSEYRAEAEVLKLAGGKQYTAKTCPGRPCSDGCDHKTPALFVPHFGGDPRGAVLVLKVPSGFNNSWGGYGLCVPAKGFSAAQMERICR